MEWRTAIGVVDGDPAIVIAAPRRVRLDSAFTHSGSASSISRSVGVSDYKHCPWMIRVAATSASTYPRPAASRNTGRRREHADERRDHVRARRFEWIGAGRDRRDEQRADDVSDTEWRMPPALGPRSPGVRRGDDSGGPVWRAECGGRLGEVFRSGTEPVSRSRSVSAVCGSPGRYAQLRERNLQLLDGVQRVGFGQAVGGAAEGSRALVRNIRKELPGARRCTR